MRASARRMLLVAAPVLVSTAHASAQAPVAAPTLAREGPSSRRRSSRAEEDRALLALFDGLRVADVTDGMDAMGLQNVGLMDPEVRPLWKDTQDYSHRFVGIAVTARYVPTQRPGGGEAAGRGVRQVVGGLVQHAVARAVPGPAPARHRPRDRRRRARRRRLDRLEQHHGVEAARGGRRGDGRHRARHRRDRHREDAALLPPARPRHPARPQRDRVGEPTHRLRRRARHARRRRSWPTATVSWSCRARSRPTRPATRSASSRATRTAAASSTRSSACRRTSRSSNAGVRS